MEKFFEFASNINLNFPALLVGFVILIFVIGAFLIMYHLTRFGIGSQPKSVAFVFFIGSFFLLAAVVSYYSRVEFNLTSELLKNLYPDSLFLPK